MEYISAEEFLKQDIDIQIIFMEWWIPTLGDIYRDLTPRTDDKFNLIHVCEDEFDRKDTELTKENFGGIIPLLTEGQLRKFIEDKCSKIEIQTYEDGEYTLTIFLHGSKYKEVDSNNLLQAYWKVAIQIAEESLIKGKFY